MSNTTEVDSAVLDGLTGHLAELVGLAVQLCTATIERQNHRQDSSQQELQLDAVLYAVYEMASAAVSDALLAEVDYVRSQECCGDECLGCRLDEATSLVAAYQGTHA